MPIRVTFVQSTGATRTLEATPGMSLMEVAKANAVPEIEAECGGACTCASCHIYVDPAWVDILPPMSRNEDVVLALLDERHANSRLSCQLRLTEELHGLIVRTVAPA